MQPGAERAEAIQQIFSDEYEPNWRARNGPAAPRPGWSQSRAEAGGAAISVDIGHAAPLMVDFDRDGKQDLLVGQFGDGKLRIYRNVGDNHTPKFDKYAWFKAGGADGKVPAG